LLSIHQQSKRSTATALQQLPEICGVEETLTQETVKDILASGGRFETNESDAVFEWLLCLASALQAYQQVSFQTLESNFSVETSANAGLDSNL
jgi:hypothetical protein